MVTEFVEGKKYKCIDVEGFVASWHGNKVILDTHFDGGRVLMWKGLEVRASDGAVVTYQGREILRLKELQYLSLVEDKAPLWDGKEDLEAGMALSVMNSFGTCCILKEINYIKGSGETQYLLQGTYTDFKTLHLVYFEDLVSLVPDEKEIFSKEVLSKWQRTGLDLAQETLSDSAPIGEIVDICWDVFNKGGDDA